MTIHPGSLLSWKTLFRYQKKIPLKALETIDFPVYPVV